MTSTTVASNSDPIKEFIDMVASNGGTIISKVVKAMFPIEIKCKNGHPITKRWVERYKLPFCSDCSSTNTMDKVIKFIKDICNDEPQRNGKVEDQLFTLIVDGDPKVGIDILPNDQDSKKYLEKMNMVTKILKMRYILFIEYKDSDIVPLLNQMINSETAFITNYINKEKDIKIEEKPKILQSTKIIDNKNETRTITIKMMPPTKVTPGTISQAQALLEAYAEEERKKHNTASEFEKEYNQRVEVKGVRMYIRVSTEEQAKTGFSLDTQTKRLEVFATERNYPIMGWYADKGISAKDIDGRPEMVKLLKEIQPFEQILCTDLTRLSRDMGNFSQIRKEVYDKRATIRIITMDYDISHPNVKSLINFQASMAETERDYIAQRTKAVMNDMASRGKLRAYAKYGFRYNEKSQLIIVPEEMKTVDYIRFLVAREPGITRTEICNRLNSSSKHKPRSAKKWHHTQVTRIMDYYDIPYKKPNNETDILPNVIEQSKTAVMLVIKNDEKK